MVNYHEIDSIFDKVEPVFLTVAVQYCLKRTSIERWRWDEPAITLTWVGNDGISRNIHTIIIEEGSSPSKVEVEVNAWKDEDREEGKIRERRWRHEIVGQLELPLDTSKLQKIVSEGCRMVSEWDKERLEVEGKKTCLASGTAAP